VVLARRRAHHGDVSWVDEALPLPPARPVEADEALEAAIHALAALGAGIAAIQLMSAVVFGDVLPAVVFAGALVATGACAFAGEGTSFRRAAFVLGGSATVLVWLTVLPQAEGQSALVVLGMAAGSAALTRRWLAGTGPRARPAYDGPRAAPPDGWIEDDLEDVLAGPAPRPM
jgi:hypothetical protein